MYRKSMHRLQSAVGAVAGSLQAGNGDNDAGAVDLRGGPHVPAEAHSVPQLRTNEIPLLHTTYSEQIDRLGYGWMGVW